MLTYGAVDRNLEHELDSQYVTNIYDPENRGSIGNIILSWKTQMDNSQVVDLNGLSGHPHAKMLLEDI